MYRVWVMKSTQSLLEEVIAVCSDIHLKNINALCEKSIEVLMLNLVVKIVTTGL
jgi:hypothetical protein